MIVKSLLGIALAAMVTGGASVATHQALQGSSERTVQNQTVSASAGTQVGAESDFDANFDANFAVQIH